MFCIVLCNETANTEIYTYLHTLSLHDALPIFVLVEILTEDGVTGIGEAVTPCGPWWSGDSVEAIKATIDRYLAPLLVGENLLAPTRLMAKLDEKVDRKSTRLNSSH